MTSEFAAGALLPMLYSLDQRHWWSSGMRAIVLALLDAAPMPAGAILEIGCGAGQMARALARRYPNRAVIGIDLHPLALPRSRHGLSPASTPWFVQADLHGLPVKEAACGLVVALDVLDQEGVAPEEALVEARRVLTANGLLLVRVSAYDWLISPHDRAFGTARRFTAAELRSLLAQAGLATLRLTHANTLLLPPAIAMRLAERSGWASVEWELTVPPGLNRALRAVLHAEARWLRRWNLPVGLSLYALAKKR